MDMSIAFEGRDKGSIVTAGLHVGVIRSTAPFGGNPGDVLIRILDVAGFAVDAILRVDDKTWLPFLLKPFVDAGWTIARRWPAIAVMLGGLLQAGIRHLEMHRLILLMIGIGEKHRGETVEGELAVRLGIDDRHAFGGRLERCKIRLAVAKRAEQ